MRQQRPEDVGVGGGNRGAAGVDQAGLARAGRKFGGVDQVAVVSEGDAGACGCVAKHRLGVLPRRGSARGVAAVADRHVALHGAECLLVEHLADQPEVLEHQHLGAVCHGDARGFLASVLQGVQAVIGELGDLFAGSPHAEYAALFSWFVLRLLDGHDKAAPMGRWVTCSVYGQHGSNTESRAVMSQAVSTMGAGDSIPCPGRRRCRQASSSGVELHHRQDRRDLRGPGTRHLQLSTGAGVGDGAQPGCQQQPGARVGLDDVGRIATGVLGS